MKYLLTFVLLLSLNGVSFSDEYRPAYLELKQSSENTFNMLWKVPAKGTSRRLSLYAILSDDVKITQVRSVFSGGAYIEHSVVTRAGGLKGIDIRIRGLKNVATDVLVRIQRLNGTSETARLNSATVSYTIRGTPEFKAVIQTYVLFGIEHILEGADHLLFIACLVFIAGTWRRILLTISGFTLAHSITLTLAALGLVRIPVPPVEATIALSIVFLAREIALDRRETLTWRYPIMVSASFGLLHGFGFASALRDIGLPKTEIPAALLAFNAGVEIGQVLFVVVILVFLGVAENILQLLKQGSNTWFKHKEKPVSYIVGGIAMLWTLERISNFFL